jgi:hypothetical protein
MGIFAVLASATAGPKNHSLDEPLFRRCIDWMMSGYGGSMIDNVCLEEYEIPPPSLFICARKVRIGFTSEADREGCAIIFDEEARKARAGYVK